MTCLNCGAETDNGLALCALCQRYGAEVFSALPVYFKNLARWRPGRAGSRPVPGSRVLYDGGPTDRSDRVMRTLDAAANDLSTWARVLADSRPYMADLLEVGEATEAETVAHLCGALGEHLTSIATTDWCGQMLGELGRHEEHLRSLTEQVAPGWYAGGCERCDGGLYVVPGLTWVTCHGCGTTTYARDRLDVVLSEARGWVARPKALAEAIVALVDTEQSVSRLHGRIRLWAHRGNIPSIRAVDADGDEVGPRRHRFGDTLDALERYGPSIGVISSETVSA